MIVKNLSNVDVVAGESFTLETEIRGSPLPTVKW